MSFNTSLIGAMAALALTGAVWADEQHKKITIMDPYARSSTASSASGAAFMTLLNPSDQDDRLLAASSDVAERVELHTHIEDENGVMKMREIEGGIELSSGESHALRRGGDHVMFLGLKQPLQDGEVIPLALTFEKAGVVVIDVPVDLKRKPEHGGKAHGPEN